MLIDVCNIPALRATSFTFLFVNEPIVPNPCALPISCPTVNGIAPGVNIVNCSSKLFQFSTIPDCKVKVAVAIVPVPVEIAIVGALVYPDPGLVIVIAETTSPVTVAVAASPVPFVPALSTCTVGERLVYPVPAFVIVGVNPFRKLPAVHAIAEPVLVELKLIQSKFSFANLPVVVPNLKFALLSPMTLDLYR